jgi:hypothetical protein
MKDIDQHIKEALEVDAPDGDPGIFDLIGDTLKGRLRFLNMLGVAAGIIFMALGVLAAVRFFQVDSTREMIAWATGFGFCMMAVAMIKVWYWLELSKHALMREVKRVELQLAALSSRIGKD